MLLTPSFLLTILFIVISPSLAFDGSRGKESAEHLDNIPGFYNILRQSSKPKVSPSQDVDNMRKEENVKRVEDVRGNENVKRSFKSASACFCGVTSAHCCLDQVLRKIEEVRRSFAVPKADFANKPTSERLQLEDRH
ncbi:hypothetical protein ACROYT_G022133 [Oculina patagonica]